MQNSVEDNQSAPEVHIKSPHAEENLWPSKHRLEAAQTYASLGWLVIPVKQDKAPYIKEWPERATADPDKISKWWNQWPEANVGIVTGEASGLAVLDVDAGSGGFETLEQLEHEYGALPNTLITQTGGGGRHYLFRYPEEGFKNSAAKLGAGLDTRGTGGFIVAPPSLHSSGNEYHWQDDEPGDFELAEVPGWILDLLKQKKSRAKGADNSNTTSNEIIKEGGRNDALASLAGGLRREGKEYDEILNHLLEANKTRCQPPLAEDEVQGIAESVSNYEPGSVPGSQGRIGSYEMTAGSIIWHKRNKDGEAPTQLANFTARISAEIEEDDGVMVSRLFEIVANIRGRAKVFKIPANELPSMNWALRELGVGAIISPGATLRDHTRAAIQTFSEDAIRRTVFTHLGWRKIDDVWHYLNTGGPIGPLGPAPDVEVALGDSRLRDFLLPAPPDKGELKTAILASLSLLNLAPRQILLPILAAVFRAPLGEASPIDFALWLVGPTGCQKTEVSALAQAHFGAGFHGKNLPGNWTGTDNSLEKQAFLIKDAVFTIDDFAPGGTQYDITSLHRKAERILRAQGNRSGRTRMRADGSLRPEYFPRGLIISSGEDIAKGHSVRARALILEMNSGDVDLEALTNAQQQAAEGVFSHVMAGYLKWLAPQMDRLKKEMPGTRITLRDEACRLLKVHSRTPDLIASLMLGWKTFLKFAKETGAITEQEHENFDCEGWEILGEVAKSQSGHQQSQDPAERFIELFEAALMNGMAYCAAMNGALAPEASEQWGWQREGGGDMRPKGRKIGWVDEDNRIFLEPQSAFQVIQQFAGNQGEPFPVTQATLWKRLDQRGWIGEKEAGRHTTRKVIEGRRRRVINLIQASYASEAGPSGPHGPVSANNLETKRLMDRDTDQGAKNSPELVHSGGPLAAGGQGAGSDGPDAPRMQRKGDGDLFREEEW